MPYTIASRSAARIGQNGRVRRVALVVGVLVSLAVAPSAGAATLHYWFQADPVEWNVVPSGRDPITGATFLPSETTFQTTVYRRYTRNWGQLRPDTAAVGDNDGIPGPTIRAREGDTVLIHFRNADTVFGRPHSMHFHGFHYTFAHDGAFIPGVAEDPRANVQPGQSVTYRMRARRGSVGVWPYHDHSASMHEQASEGLYGMISIRGRRERRPHRENIVIFSELLNFQTVNGRAFIGNTPTFRARINEIVQWSVLAFGDSHHTFHLHGHRWRWAGANIDTRNVGPAESFRFRIKEDVRGSWLYHCHVNFHMDAGMVGLYRVAGRIPARNRTRTLGGTGGARLTGKPLR